MGDEEVEVANVKRVGVLSLAGTFAFISFFSSIIFSVILYFVVPMVLGLFSLQSPVPISVVNLLLFCLGSAVTTFILTIFLGLFYNLSALITKGIKLYSS